MFPCYSRHSYGLSAWSVLALAGRLLLFFLKALASFAGLYQLQSLPVAKAKDLHKYDGDFAWLTSLGASKGVYFQRAREALGPLVRENGLFPTSMSALITWSQMALPDLRISHSHTCRGPSAFSSHPEPSCWMEHRATQLLLSAQIHFFLKLK